ncbi:hypothetical protein [Nocardioides massiliensis]|uniref:Uncharacterized protein n=1 Tax=Nocardioides massiliensis TaxID=1325935 RepID=A0ABT9NMB5_9ACTN|nr:hypothetical protein [Nocardioides massiliensis]MDP9820970.1 hypothetical protein [Nocardioides massiliensis]
MTATTTDGIITAAHTAVEDDVTVVSLHDRAGRALLTWNETGGTRSQEWLAQLQVSQRPADLQLDELVVAVLCGPEPTLAVYEPFVDGEPSLLSLFELTLPLPVTHAAAELHRDAH